jgi:hypothetical protein
MRRLACVIGVLALTAGAAGASTVPCGLRGTVYVMSGGACLDDCSGKKPLGETTLVFSSAGRVTARTVTRADGTFRVRLAPGAYGVRLGGGLAMHISPSRASVTRGTFKTIQFVAVSPKTS